MLFVKRMDKERSRYVIMNLPEGTLYGKLWFVPNPDRFSVHYNERITHIKTLPYCTQVPGYYIFVTIENYTGIDSLPDLYDINSIARQMADYMLEVIQQSPGKYKDNVCN